MRPTIVALTQDFSYGVIEELRTFDAERTGVHGADMKFLFSREGRMGAPRRLQPARGRGQPDRYANVDAP